MINQSEIHFLNLHSIKKGTDERYETFYQRIVSHLEDNLLTVASGIIHDGEAVAVDECMSPTTERVAVYLWLLLIDPRLPAFFQRVFSNELQTKSLKEIQPILSQSMDSLLSQLSTQDDIQVHYARSYRSNSSNNKQT